MNTNINENIFFNQLAELDNNSNNEMLLKKDLQLHGRIIKNVPVYPDYKNNPSENVSGDVLSRMYRLIKENKNQKVIEYC